MENFQKYKVLLTENNNFRKLFAARLITLGGDWLLTVPLLGIIYELTENPFITSLVLVVQSAPLFMLGSFGGYLADRFDRKKLIAISEFLSGLTVLLILYAVTTENVVFILISFGLLSVAGSPYMPTSDAALPNVVKKENLAEANVIFFSSWGVMAGLGAGLGGYLTTVISRNMLFAIDSLSFVLSALIVFSINKNLSDKSYNKKEEDISYKEGLKYAASSIIFLSKRKEKDGTEIVGNIIHCKNAKSRLTVENRMVDVRLTYDKGLDRYYGLLDLALAFDVFKKQGTRVLLPTGKTEYGKTINNNPEKYFTEEVMADLEVVVNEYFKYGKSTSETGTDDSQESSS